MKILLLVAALLAIAMFFHFQSGSQQNDEFKSWMRENKKVYGSEEIEQYRRNIYNQNKIMIENTNKRQKSYTLAPNQFMDLTSQEFKYTYLGLINQRNGKKKITESRLGDSVDWRTKGAVQVVKDQGQCGSCWAFSAVGCLESADFVFKGTLGDFSEQQLVDCSQNYGNYGCNGGWMDYAFEYVIANGITTEQAYPYVAVDQKCKQQGGAFKVTGYTDVDPGDCNTLKTFIAKAPTSVAVDAENWSFYSSGIFNSCGDDLDHGVLAVGYTDDYWIIKNSWGVNWGEQGYIRLASGDTCGVCDAASQVYI